MDFYAINCQGKPVESLTFPFVAMTQGIHRVRVRQRVHSLSVSPRVLGRQPLRVLTCESSRRSAAEFPQHSAIGMAIRHLGIGK